MPTFPDLPLELRSPILKDWLDDTIAKRVAQGAHQWESVIMRAQLDPHVHTDYVQRRADMARKIAQRRDVLALEIVELVDVFVEEDQLELKRLLEVHVGRLEGQKRPLGTRIEELRRGMIGSFYAGALGLERAGIMEEWIQRWQEAKLLEWSCNMIQSALGVDRVIWTTFKVHRVGCGWGRDKTCKCQATELSIEMNVRGQVYINSGEDDHDRCGCRHRRAYRWEGWRDVDSHL